MVEEDLSKAWGFERQSTEGFIRRETQRAHEKAVSAGRTGSAFAARQLSIALCAEVKAKAARVTAKTRDIFESHGVTPAISEDASLRDRFQRLLQDESAAAQAAIFKSDVANQAVTRLSQGELGNVRDKADHEFKLMLAALRTVAAKAQSTMNISNSNVQVGDNNTQNNQLTVTVFRDMLAKIDASSYTEAEKAAAKSKVSELLNHPIIVSTVGAIANHVFK